MKDEIKRRVEEHYEARADPLLLSKLGSEMRKDGLPTEENGRGLLDLARQLAPDIVAYQDPDSPAYIAIYPSSRHDEMKPYFEARSAYRFLSALPKSVILAFCIQVSDGEKVCLRIKNPIRYTRGSTNNDPDFIEVDEDLRFSGLYIEAINSIPREQVTSLARNINHWFDKNGITIEDLKSSENGLVDVLGPSANVEKEGKTALDRLLEAQPSEIAGKLVIPADIAVHLSKLR